MKNEASIQIRLTKEQKDKARLIMQNKGHKTLSSFIRSLIFEYDSEKMLREIYEKIVIEVTKNGR